MDWIQNENRLRPGGSSFRRGSAVRDAAHLAPRSEGVVRRVGPERRADPHALRGTRRGGPHPSPAGRPRPPAPPGQQAAATPGHPHAFEKP
ncbi:hypothetical protein SBD_5927 [Streptomyces bottropensis ATCC 25435]|uniref:Uncharacterized protein n=1 Tax=Streptomyces bottropensis ATCC 25435 TaxID=1054862 RepID=M3E9L8_9ACTN|nr:hypothetical protein SBD_5927 [Streptomyces bottropensis ATCC 25435]